MQIIKCLLIGFLLYSYVSSSRNCKNCGERRNEFPVEELRLIRCEYLKNQILQKLHLSVPPKTNLPKPPLTSVLILAAMVENSTVELEEQPKLESVVIYPTETNLTCLKNQAETCNLYEFRIPESLLFDKFVSSEIWIHQQNLTKYLRANQIITDPFSHYSRKFELSYPTVDKHIGNWRKYALPNESFISEFIRENVLVLEVVSERNETGIETLVEITEDEKPFLIIRGRATEAVTRSRRSLTCAEHSSSCCKENFFLNFSEIGWDNWILHPDGYEANFCRGRCFNDLSNTRFYHSAVLLSYIRDNRDIADEIGLNMCCTPSIMAPLTIIYRNEEEIIYHKTIENMKVEACDCA